MGPLMMNIVIESEVGGVVEIYISTTIKFDESKGRYFKKTGTGTLRGIKYYPRTNG